MAQRKVTYKLGRLFALIAAILAVRRWGIKRIRTEALMFFLMRYQNALQILQFARSQLPARLVTAATKA